MTLSLSPPHNLPRDYICSFARYRLYPAIR
jgi:hypothetical protein